MTLEGTVQFSIETSNKMLGTYTTSDSRPMEKTLPNDLIATDESTTNKGVCVCAMDGKSKLTVIAFNNEFTSTETFQASPSIHKCTHMHTNVVNVCCFMQSCTINPCTFVYVCVCACACIKTVQQMLNATYVILRAIYVSLTHF